MGKTSVAARVAYIFEPTTKRITLADIQPLHIVTEAAKKSPKYRQIVASIREIGIVEPPVVVRDKDSPHTLLRSGWSPPS